jgi:hypothetical protein
VFTPLRIDVGFEKVVAKDVLSPIYAPAFEAAMVRPLRGRPRELLQTPQSRNTHRPYFAFQRW